jgi:hypothetical protein
MVGRLGESGWTSDGDDDGARTNPGEAEDGETYLVQVV